MNKVFSDLKLFTCNAHPELANEIAELMGIKVGKSTVNKFSDGEIQVSIWESVRDCDVYVVQPTCAPVNDHLMELLIMIDALKRASAGRINAVIPYYGYARQDRKAKARDPITAKLVANLIQAAGADRVISMNIIGDIDGKNCILLDDMIDTAGTICNAASALIELGAKNVYACATHGVLSGPAKERLEKSPIQELVLLNTLPIDDEKKLDKMTFISVGPIFSEVITRVYQGGSVSTLFD